MDPKQFLQTYVTAKLPDIVAGEFEGAPDVPAEAVDQRYIPLQGTVARG